MKVPVWVAGCQDVFWVDDRLTPSSLQLFVGARCYFGVITGSPAGVSESFAALLQHM